VRLFVDRAQAARPGFTVTPVDSADVQDICWRLDGIPLAIELAAARMRVFGIEQIAARLGDRFRLLTAGPRTAMPRQQTLQATVAWSYALLTDAERTVLGRLAVFAGGWTQDARDCHLSWALSLADECEPMLHGPDAGAAMDRLEAELDNLRTALDWALQSRPDTALRLSRALGWFWWGRDYHSEGRRWLER